MLAGTRSEPMLKNGFRVFRPLYYIATTCRPCCKTWSSPTPQLAKVALDPVDSQRSLGIWFSLGFRVLAFSSSAHPKSHGRSFTWADQNPHARVNASHMNRCRDPPRTPETLNPKPLGLHVPRWSGHGCLRWGPTVGLLRDVAQASSACHAHNLRV